MGVIITPHNLIVRNTGSNVVKRTRSLVLCKGLPRFQRACLGDLYKLTLTHLWASGLMHKAFLTRLTSSQTFSLYFPPPLFYKHFLRLGCPSTPRLWIWMARVNLSTTTRFLSRLHGKASQQEFTTPTQGRISGTGSGSCGPDLKFLLYLQWLCDPGQGMETPQASISSSNTKWGLK